MSEIDPELLLHAYRSGLFPMARSRDDPDLQWFSPLWRGILPLNGVHVPRRLKRTLRGGRFEIRCNSAFRRVMEFCAAPAPDREDSWISPRIIELYTTLHQWGFCHSVECWQDGELAGGLYGVALGGAFFGESMFSRQRDASKVALIHLVARLRIGGFTLLDTQFLTDHLVGFGAMEIERDAYLARLEEAAILNASFPAMVDNARLNSELETLFRESLLAATAPSEPD